MKKEINIDKESYMSELSKLNLPVIQSKKSVVKHQTGAKKIAAIDLSKNTAVHKILNTKDSIQHELIDKNRGLDLMLVGDLTASMTEYHVLLKRKFKELCIKLFSLIKNLRVGIIFYLDYDRHLPYVTSICQPTSDVERIYSFIETTPVDNFGNSTFEEAVETALNDLLHNIQWKELHTRSVVLFGDARPHNCHECPEGYDFWGITKDLYSFSTTINSVYCGKYFEQSMQDLYSIEIGDFRKRIENLNHDAFFSWIANVTGGMALAIKDIDDLIDIIITSAAKDAGKLDDLEMTVKNEPKKLNLVKLAKKAELRKLSTGNRKLIEGK